jgi:hypothetical protein
MPAKTESEALKELASITTTILQLLTGLINFRRSIPPGCLDYCNHTYHDNYPTYHASIVSTPLYQEDCRLCQPEALGAVRLRRLDRPH